MTEVSRNSNRLYKYCISISYICTYNLHLCICIYIHVNLGRVMDVYAYTYIHTYIHTHIHTHIYIPVINVCVRSVFSTCLHVSIVTLSTEFNICRSISVCVYTYIYIYIHICIHVFTHIHA